MDETIFPIEVPAADEPGAGQQVDLGQHESRLARLEVIARELLRLNAHRSPVLKEMWEKSQES